MSQALIARIKGHNNTRAWVHGNAVYIDTMKSDKPFRKIAEEFHLDFTELHVETKEECLFGIEGSDLVFGGQKTNCHVYMIHTCG